MDRLVKPDAIAARYGVSRKTAIRYIRKMQHLEKPVRVWMSEVLKWEQERSMMPMDYIQAAAKFQVEKKALKIYERKANRK